MIPPEDKRRFFDGLADRWDTFGDIHATRRMLLEVLQGLGLRPEERILDLGSGTGIATEALLLHLSDAGRIDAVDFSGEMIRAARAKLSDPRVCWHAAEASRLPFPDGVFDRVLCFSSWPHFHDPEGVADELHRVLRPGGILHILHLISRIRVNEIHSSEGGAIGNDLLPSGTEVASLLVRHGFGVEVVDDSAERYFLSAVRRAVAGGSSE